jgi:peptidoglycan/LPS O-acetylase OafA/YrhL
VAQRFDNVQALRGVACLMVVVYHTAGIEAQFGLRFNLLRVVQWFGYAGVDLFFVLSGFIITATCRADLGRADRLPRYLFRRFWRIFPAYWAVLPAAVAFYACSGPKPVFGPNWPAEWCDTLLLLPQPAGCRFLPVAWTLSYELMFYVAFAALFLLPRRAAVPALGGWAVLVAWAAAAGHMPGNRFTALWVNPYVLEFLAGAAIAWCPVRLSGRRAAALVAAALAWCAIASAVAFDPDPMWLTYTVRARVPVFGPPVALVVLAAVGRERAGGRVGWRWLGHAGDASYSIYLTHVTALIITLCLTFLVGWSHNRSGHVAWVAVMLVAGVASGLLFHRLVERPLLDLWKRKPKPAVVESEPPARVAA